MRSTFIALATALFATSACAQMDDMPRTESAPGTVAYIISPAHGEIVSSPFKVQFGLIGMGVAPAGVDYPDTGHHHLLINRELMDMSVPMPSGDDDLLHFGAGQTEAMVTLAPGEYTLQMALGDQDHVPHDPPILSTPITITVK